MSDEYSDDDSFLSEWKCDSDEEIPEYPLEEAGEESIFDSCHWMLHDLDEQYHGYGRPEYYFEDFLENEYREDEYQEDEESVHESFSAMAA